MYGDVGSICSTSSTRYGVTPALRRRRQEDQKAVFGRLQAWAVGDPVLGEWGGLRVSEEVNRGEEPGTEPWPTFQVWLCFHGGVGLHISFPFYRHSPWLQSERCVGWDSFAPSVNAKCPAM